jgi:lipoate---protein ligase
VEPEALMEIENEYKVPGGKLIRIRATIVDGRITMIEIHGDFFLHPESALELIEDELIGARLDEVAARINRTLAAQSAQLIGCAPEDIESMIRRTD